MAENDGVIFKIGADAKDALSSVDEVASRVQSLGGVFTKVLGGLAVVQIGKATFELAKMGEEINAINKRFEILANDAGVNVDKVTEGIATALNGTVDMEDALQASSQALIKLGENGDRIPQIFELAKKAANAFGGDTIERFNQISQAISSGMTRSLKEIGINVDTEKALKRYADVVGTTVQNLSEAQRQQAILNEVLTTGATKFKNVDSSLTPLSTATKQASVAMGELVDAFALLANQALTPALISFLKFFTDLTNATNKAIESIRTFFSLTESQQESLNYLAGNVARIAQNYRDSKAATDANNQSIAAAKPLYDATASSVQVLTEAQKEQRDALLEVQRAQQGLYEDFVAGQTTFANFTDGFSDGMKRMAGNAKQLGGVISQTLVGGMANALQGLGASLVGAGDGFNDFGKTMLKMLGQMAIQIGTFLILAGIGFAALPIGFTATAAIAAGSALVVLGGALTAMGSGGSTSSATPAQASFNAQGQADGGGLASSGINNDVTSNEERARPSTGVTVVVQGNILDRRESGLAIAEILNEAFDTNGVLVRANA